jgi:folate-binding protein YgfZ
MCTADVKGLSQGRIARALFLTERAHIIADCFIYAVDDGALWLEIERPRWPAIREHLEHFLVADDVELEELDDVAVLDIEGAASTDVAAAVFGNPMRQLERWQSLATDKFRVANLPRYGRTAFTVIADPSVLSGVAERVKQSRPGILEVSADIIETLRIENGLARIGVDTNERTLALEARLEPAISFNKGCYIGQETVERATAHGSLKRRLFGVRIGGNEIPLSGTVIQLDGKEVGRLSSVTDSPSAGIIGLAILHHSAWAPGTQLSIVGDAATVGGSVSELPFEKSHRSLIGEARI